MRRTAPMQVLVLFTLVIATLAALPRVASAATARPWLGVYTQEVTNDLREGLDLHDDGVLVNRVVDGSPADRAGLRKGDLVVRFDAHAVDSPETLARLVGQEHDGQIVALEVLRRGEHRTLSVTLAPRPEDDDESMAPSAPDAPAPPGDDDGDDDAAPRQHPRRIVMNIVRPDGTTEHRELPESGEGTTVDPEKVRVMTQKMLGNMSLDGLNLRPRLGVRIEPLTDDLASALDVPGGEGVMVLGVTKDTPAERAGVRAGDVILAVDGRPVKTPEELQKTLRGVNGKTSLSVSRKGTRRTIEADLGQPKTQGWGDLHFRGEPGRLEIPPQLDTPRARSDADSDELRSQVDDLRQQVKELRRQLEDLKDHH